eukprot:15271538-Alexandrium_andersonii.AAC.1
MEPPLSRQADEGQKEAIMSVLAEIDGSPEASTSLAEFEPDTPMEAMVPVPTTPTPMEAVPATPLQAPDFTAVPVGSENCRRVCPTSSDCSDFKAGACKPLAL